MRNFIFLLWLLTVKDREREETERTLKKRKLKQSLEYQPCWLVCSAVLILLFLEDPNTGIEGGDVGI